MSLFFHLVLIPFCERYLFMVMSCLHLKKLAKQNVFDIVQVTLDFLLTDG